MSAPRGSKWRWPGRSGLRPVRAWTRYRPGRTHAAIRQRNPGNTMTSKGKAMGEAITRLRVDSFPASGPVRLRPPAHLNAEQARIWCQLSESLPPSRYAAVDAPLLLDAVEAWTRLNDALARLRKEAKR